MKNRRVGQQFPEIHPRRAPDCIERVALGVPQPAAIHAVFLFEMSDARFDRGSSFHPAPQSRPWAYLLPPPFFPLVA